MQLSVATVRVDGKVNSAHLIVVVKAHRLVFLELKKLFNVLVARSALNLSQSSLVQFNYVQNGTSSFEIGADGAGADWFIGLDHFMEI
jgi:hypothetical protein